MNKKLMIIISVIAMTAMLGLWIYHSDAANSGSTLTKDEIRSMLESQYPGEITELELEKEGNKAVYEIEIKGDGKRYEVKLDAYTGEVLKLQEKTLLVNEDTKNNRDEHEEVSEKGNVEVENDNKNNDVDDGKEKSNNNTSNAEKDDSSNRKDSTNQATDSPKDNKENSSKKAVIDVETAKEIAIAEFAGKVTELELDEDDGRLIYEIEVESSKGEAEFEIDAYTGEILVISIDIDFDDDDDDDDD